MNREVLIQLSTGDWVKNTETNQVSMITIFSHPKLNTLSVEELGSGEDWELERSRFITTKEELARLKEYHDHIKEQMKDQKR